MAEEVDAAIFCRTVVRITMSDISRLLEAAHGGDRMASEQLMPLLYSELRAMAAQYMMRENPEQTLQPTALVHEAFLRLVGDQHFESRGHFFAAAAQAMRRILVDNARRKQRQKRGGQAVRQPLDLNEIAAPADDAELLALHDALEQLAIDHPRPVRLVELRFFGGMTMEESAEFLGLSLSTADRDWRYARAWLYAAMEKREKTRDA